MSHNGTTGTAGWDNSDPEFYRWISTQAIATASAAKVKAKLKDPIETATDDVLILELIKRGFAVGKLDGQKVD